MTKLKYFRGLAVDATRKGTLHFTKLTGKGYTGQTMRSKYTGENSNKIPHTIC